MSKKRKILMIICIIITGFILYARFVGTLGLKIKEYNIINKNIPESFYGSKIVHITDIHYGRITNGKELEKLVNEINKIEPDIVIFTGDLLDKDITYTNNMIETLTKELNKIKASLGKYAVWGNHDYLNNTANYDEIITSSGFKLLKNSYEIIYKGSNKGIFLSGLDDFLEGELNPKNITDYYQLEEGEEKELPTYKILLTHEPDVIDSYTSFKFNLVLAGHSHNGQVKAPLLGALWTPPGSKKYYKPYYDLGDTKLYISSGIGTSTLNLRFLEKPSFNLYRLRNK